MTTDITLEQLEAAIRASWSAETAHSPQSWSADNPSGGQCWTTAYVVRHFFKGEIILAEVLPHTDPIARHAWNRLPTGIEIDFTRDQFPSTQEFRECTVPESVIIAVSGKQAYLLLERVEAVLNCKV